MTTLILRIERDLKEHAQSMAKELGISLSALVKILLTDAVNSGCINIDIDPSTFKPHKHDGPMDLPLS